MNISISKDTNNSEVGMKKMVLSLICVGKERTGFAVIWLLLVGAHRLVTQQSSFGS